uniref:Protein kinase domain-containing protein n=1 Tax=Rhodnius prolixus TaxID=13249 RepID=T1HDV1_RHOPR
MTPHFLLECVITGDESWVFLSTTHRNQAPEHGSGTHFKPLQAQKIFVQSNCATRKFPSAGNTNHPGQLTEERQNLSAGAVDLITRLLQVNPTSRLRNFLTLRTLKFFHGFRIDKIKSKQRHPKELLEEHFPVDDAVEVNNSCNPEMVQSEILFYDFDQYKPTIV